MPGPLPPPPTPPSGSSLPGLAPPASHARASTIASIMVAVIVLSGILAIVSPGGFQPIVVLFGILVAAVIFMVASWRADGPGSFLWELKELHQEVTMLRQALETARCQSCGGVVPSGSNYCPHCGLRQG